MPTYNKFDFSKKISSLNSVKSIIPITVANKARNHFLKSWDRQGFTGSAFEQWQEVQRRIPGTQAYKYPKNIGLSRRKKAILVDTGKLRREVANSIRYANWTEIRLGVSDATPYAAAQNEGTDTIPKREFMGKSPILQADIKEYIRITILNALR